MNIKEWSERRETSIEIAESILELSNSKAEMERIWLDPKNKLTKIMRKAFLKTDENTLFWGVETMSRDSFM